MTPTTLVFGGRGGEREAAIAAVLTPGLATAIIVEGLADGLTNEPPAASVHSVQLVRIAPGCLCCAGNLILRVTLNRILRRPPAQLFISLADGAHAGALRASLSQAPYQQLLLLQPDIVLGGGEVRRGT